LMVGEIEIHPQNPAVCEESLIRRQGDRGPLGEIIYRKSIVC